ncbi:hypothetical protein PanWU01x14_083230, partial [Parasponia andersonii]
QESRLSLTGYVKSVGNFLQQNPILLFPLVLIQPQSLFSPFSHRSQPLPLFLSLFYPLSLSSATLLSPSLLPYYLSLFRRPLSFALGSSLFYLVSVYFAWSQFVLLSFLGSWSPFLSNLGFERMSSHGSTPLATNAASGSNSGDDRHDPKGKRVRKQTRGCSVEKELRRLKTDRLKVEFCEKTGKPILDHGKMFLNILAKTVRDTIPASTPTWKDMKKEYIE